MTKGIQKFPLQAVWPEGPQNELIKNLIISDVVKKYFLFPTFTNMV
jgi:hypothetical protein